MSQSLQNSTSRSVDVGGRGSGGAGSGGAGSGGAGAMLVPEAGRAWTA